MASPAVPVTPSAAARARRPKRDSIVMLVERRFPLHLEPSLATVRELYDRAKAARWDPAAIPWRRLDPARYSDEQRTAARLIWSRRAWIEYGGLAETPALLVRFCLEHQRESDPKMFLTVRASAIAWHTDAAHRLATLLGGYVEAPNDRAIEALYNQNFQRAAFDGATPLDAYVAGHAVVLDGIDLELHREHLRHATDPVVLEVLRRFVSDKERQVEFGWAYLAERAGGWDDAVRGAVAAEIADALDLELSGYHAAALGSEAAFAPYVAAGEIVRDAGLGASSAAEEQSVVRRYIAEARQRLERHGITVPMLAHPALGAV